MLCLSSDHHPQPSFNGFFDVGNRLFAGLPLGETPWQSGNFGDKVPRFVLFNHNVDFYQASSRYTDTLQISFGIDVERITRGK